MFRESSLAYILAHGLLSVVALELHNTAEAERMALAAITEATTHRLTDRPELGLGLVVHGLCHEDSDSLHRGVRLVDRAGPFATAYAASVFLTSPLGRQSAWFNTIRSQAERTIRNSPNLGPIIADRWLAVGVHRRQQYGGDVLVEPLSAREVEQLRFMSSDLTQRGIALRMGVSINTAKSRSRTIFRKLEVQTRADAVSAAERLEIIDLNDD